MKKAFHSILLLALLTGVFAFSALADQAVTFPDENLELSIRQKLNHYDKPIFRSQLLDIVDLDLQDKNIKNLEGIEYCRNLEVLNLRNNDISDVAPLETLTSLRILDFGFNQISDLKTAGIHLLASHQIIELSLDHNTHNNNYGEIIRLSDIKLLSGFVHLQKLNLEGNSVESVLPLANMSLLKELNLRGNRLTELNGVERLKNLETLSLSENQITDISAINDLINLEYLNLRENNVQDINALSNLKNLQYLNLHSNTNIADLAPLRELRNIETLILRNVPVDDQIVFLGELKNLKRLNIRNTGITDLSVLAHLMRAGALQNDLESNVIASVNLLDLKQSENESDFFFPVRKYWDNISFRYPINLPYAQSDVENVEFSHKTGFYEQGFHLSLTTTMPDGRIFYTVDGSDPALSAGFNGLGSTKIYQSPIHVYDKSNEPNYLTEIRTSMVSDSYHIPESEVKKAFIVRAIVVNDAGMRSDIVTHTFFVGDHFENHYILPIVSIAMNEAYLFDDQIGIYVPGVFYEDLQQPWHISFYPANYTQRGQIWERPASFQLINQAGETLVSQNIGVRIHGGATRSYPQKSLRLYFTDHYDATDGLDFPLFEEYSRSTTTFDDHVFRSLILRNAGNDWYGSMFRDALAQNLLGHTQLDLQDFFPVIVFLNGEYWGIHNLRPRYDEAYFQSKYGVPMDELLVLVEYWGRTQIGRPGEREQYFDMLRLIDNNYSENNFATADTLADQHAYNEITALMDIDNFIDYFVSQIYFANQDWPHNNIMFWKTVNHDKSSDSDSYWYDGKWRWIVYDLDLTFEDVERNSLAFATTENEWSTYLLRSLLENQTFREKFINAFADHLNSTFREEVVVDRINEFKSIYQPEIEEHIYRWGNAGGSLETWLENVDQIIKFAQMRPAIQREQMVSYFNLPGSASITTVVNPLQGYIKINSLEIIPGHPGVDDPGHWTGVYFKHVPLSLTAFSHEGYEFSHWEMDNKTHNYDQTIEINLNEDIYVAAVFHPLSTD